MLRKLPVLLLSLLILPAALAAGFGVWSPLAGWQEHVALLGLHQISYLLLQSPWVEEGLIGVIEIPLLLGVVVLLAGLAAWWDRLLPPVGLWLTDLVEGCLALCGWVAALGLVAVGASLDRPLFWAGLVVGFAALFARSPLRLGLGRSEDDGSPAGVPTPEAPGLRSATTLAGLAALGMALSLPFYWSVSETAPSVPGHQLLVGQLGVGLSLVGIVGLVMGLGRRRSFRAAVGSVGLVLGGVTMGVLLPEESAAGPGLLAYLVSSALLLASAWVDMPRPMDAGWRGPENRVRRVVTALTAAAVLVYGATSIWEGVAYHNPLFRLSTFWLEGPGASPLASGGAWLVLGLASFIPVVWRSWARRRSDPGDLGTGGVSKRFLATVVVVGLLVLAVEWSLAGSPELAIAGTLSAAGLLLMAWVWFPVLAAPRPLGNLLDPRVLMSTFLSVLAWGALCTARGICCFMWTVPQTLPEGVEKLADASCVFSLATTASGAVYWTDRCRTDLGRVGPDGVVRTWDLAEFDAQQVEELGDAIDGTLWAAISAWTQDAQLVLLPIDEDSGPIQGPRGDAEVENDGRLAPRPVPVASCWVSAWVPIPPDQDGAPVRDVLLGCEENSTAFVFEAAERRLGPGIPLGAQLEAGAFHPDGDRLYGVALWRDASVRMWSWPYLEPMASRLLGPFNWAVALDPEDDLLWVTRFLEGQALALDAATLEVRHRVPLSFGLRAMIYEPVHDRIWAAAAYSGRLWSIEAKPPFRRTSYALCGQARDLDSDAEGRVILATDCGLFRVTPSAELEG
ncbi:MAG: hypothetical protein CL928_11325 [Deltaproteobacteria bacterium]|nr:hypothetical protein [Deltaproteobacteria bacterium]